MHIKFKLKIIVEVVFLKDNDLSLKTQFVVNCYTSATGRKPVHVNTSYLNLHRMLLSQKTFPMINNQIKCHIMLNVCARIKMFMDLSKVWSSLC